MAHSIAEMTSGLASRVKNLAAAATGKDATKLLAQQDQLAKLAMAAIVKDLDSSQSKYTDAVQALTDAIGRADAAIKKIENVAQAISSTATAIAKVAAVLA